MSSAIRQYLEDPFLRLLYEDISAAGPIRPIQMDLTHACNIRCQGCYFFAEGMDHHKAPKEEAVFDRFLEQEQARGTNFVTVLGGEPSLMPERLKKVYDRFWMLVVTNGLRRIPCEGFEDMPIVVSVWGDHETDIRLRGGGKRDVFARGLENYRDDCRALWYYTTTPGNAHEIESVVDQIVANGNYVGFNFYGDIAGLGGAVDHSRGFERVRREIDRMIDRYPDRVLATSYITRVISTGRLFDDRWGFDVCCTLSNDIPKNQERFRNGKAYLPHFRAYNSDLVTTRACCRSDNWDCANCFDTWAHLSWIMTNVDKHLGSKQDFTNWLTTTYVFHLTGRIVDLEDRRRLLPEIHRRLRAVRDDEPEPPSSPLSSGEIAELVSEVL
ncbi:MAG TPA: radical SAM protein [Thermoanaerobaculia bacterium]